MAWHNVPKCVVEGCMRDAQGFFGRVGDETTWAEVAGRNVWTCNPHRPEVEATLFVEPVPDRLRPTLQMKAVPTPLEGE